jgi:hypothetical protein
MPVEPTRLFVDTYGEQLGIKRNASLGRPLFDEYLVYFFHVFALLRAHKPVEDFLTLVSVLR